MQIGWRAVIIGIALLIGVAADGSSAGAKIGDLSAGRVAGIAAIGERGGYVLADGVGNVRVTGARFRGSPRTAGVRLRSPIVAITATADGGYVEASADGRVYAYGTRFRGSPRADGIRLRSRVVGIAAKPAGGYVLATAGGEVYSFGSRFRGSPRSRRIRLRSRVTAVATAPGGGYLVATARGNVYSFATAFHGSPVSHHARLGSRVVGIAATGNGGYYVATATGQVYAHAVGPHHASFIDDVHPDSPIVGIAATRGGFLVVTRRGSVLPGGTNLTAVPSSKKYPVGAHVETMATNASGCAGITLGSDFYQTSVGTTKAACSAGATHAWVLVLDGQTLSEQALKQLPQGAGASAGLTSALAPYIGDYQQHLVVLVAPAGCCSGDASIPNSGFSAIWDLNAGVADLADIPAKVSGAKNDGNKLVSGDANPAGGLAGYLQPINAGPQVGTYAFTAGGYLSFDTKTAQTTLIGTSRSAPQLNDVDVLVTGQATALAVKGGSTDGGQSLTGDDESDLPAQRWRLAPSGVAGDYHLVNVKTELCADITGGVLTGALEQYPCDPHGGDAPNQLWDPVLQSEGTYALVTHLDDKSVLTLNDDGTLGVAADAGLAGQRWRFRPMSGAPQGGGTAVIDTLDGKALDLAGGADTAGTDGTKAATAAEIDNSTQQWLTVPTGNESSYNGSFALVDVDTAKCLSAPDKTAGVQPDQQTCAANYDNTSQLWKPTLVDGSYVLTNLSSNLALTQSSSLGVQRTLHAKHRRHAKPKRAPRRCRARRNRPARCPRAVGDQPPAQSMWFTSRKVDVKDGLPATGSQDFYCSDYVPSGQANLFPYLVADRTSFAYRNVSNGVSASANLLASDANRGKLSLTWANEHIHGDYALQIQQECTGNNPDGWSVSSLGTSAVGSAKVTLQARVVFSGSGTVHVDYGPSTGVYPSHSANVQVSGNNNNQSVQIPVTGLQPGTTYHYRIVGTQGGAGLVYPNAYSGSDQTFTTQSYGSPLSLQPVSNASTQRWVFRPLERTETMTIGSSSYDTTMPISWAGFAVEGVAPSGAAAPAAFYTNTGIGAENSSQQAAMASSLTTLAKRAGSAVLVQSINQPQPTTSSWNDIATQIGQLGGTVSVFDALDGSGDYALAGCDGCQNAPEANTAVTQPTTHNSDADHLSGLLARTATTGWTPDLANPGDPVDYSLLPLAFSPPTPWPVPAGVAPAANTAALAWIANQLDMTAPACYAYPAGQPDVRSAYCNLNENFASDQTNLKSLTYPTNPQGLGFTSADLDAEKTELNTEFTQLATVRDLITNLRAPYQGASGTLEAYLQKTANDILTNQLPGAPSSNVVGDDLNIFGFALSAGSYFFPEAPIAAGALGISGGFLSLINSFLSQDNGQPTLLTFQDKASDLGVDLATRLARASDAISQVFNLLATDPIKLKTAYDNAKDDPSATHDWAFTSNDIAQMEDRLEFGARQELWTSLMPAEYNLFSVPSAPSGQTVQKNYECLITTSGQLVNYPPLGGEPASATFSPIASVSASGNPQVPNVLALGTGTQLDDINHTARPTANATDPLFKARNAGGIGLFKPWFYERSGFTVVNGNLSNCKYYAHPS